MKLSERVLRILEKSGLREVETEKDFIETTNENRLNKINTDPGKLDSTEKVSLSEINTEINSVVKTEDTYKDAELHKGLVDTIESVNNEDSHTDQVNTEQVQLSKLSDFKVVTPSGENKELESPELASTVKSESTNNNLHTGLVNTPESVIIGDVNTDQSSTPEVTLNQLSAESKNIEVNLSNIDDPKLSHTDEVLLQNLSESEPTTKSVNLSPLPENQVITRKSNQTKIHGAGKESTINPELNQLSDKDPSTPKVSLNKIEVIDRVHTDEVELSPINLEDRSHTDEVELSQISTNSDLVDTREIDLNKINTIPESLVTTSDNKLSELSSDDKRSITSSDSVGIYKSSDGTEYSLTNISDVNMIVRQGKTLTYEEGRRVLDDEYIKLMLYFDQPDLSVNIPQVEIILSNLSSIIKGNEQLLHYFKSIRTTSGNPVGTYTNPTTGEVTTLFSSSDWIDHGRRLERFLEGIERGSVNYSSIFTLDDPEHLDRTTGDRWNSIKPVAISNKSLTHYPIELSSDYVATTINGDHISTIGSSEGTKLIEVVGYLRTNYSSTNRIPYSIFTEEEDRTNEIDRNDWIETYNRIPYDLSSNLLYIDSKHRLVKGENSDGTQIIGKQISRNINDPDKSELLRSDYLDNNSRNLPYDLSQVVLKNSEINFGVQSTAFDYKISHPSIHNPLSYPKVVERSPLSVSLRTRSINLMKNLPYDLASYNVLNNKEYLGLVTESKLKSKLGNPYIISAFHSNNSNKPSDISSDYKIVRVIGSPNSNYSNSISNESSLLSKVAKIPYDLSTQLGQYVGLYDYGTSYEIGNPVRLTELSYNSLIHDSKGDPITDRNIYNIIESDRPKLYRDESNLELLTEVGENGKFVTMVGDNLDAEYNQDQDDLTTNYSYQNTPESEVEIDTESLASSNPELYDLVKQVLPNSKKLKVSTNDDTFIPKINQGKKGQNPNNLRSTVSSKGKNLPYSLNGYVSDKSGKYRDENRLIDETTEGGNNKLQKALTLLSKSIGFYPVDYFSELAGIEFANFNNWYIDYDFSKIQSSGFFRSYNLLSKKDAENMMKNRTTSCQWTRSEISGSYSLPTSSGKDITLPTTRSKVYSMEISYVDDMEFSVTNFFNTYYTRFLMTEDSIHAYDYKDIYLKIILKVLRPFSYNNIKGELYMNIPLLIIPTNISDSIQLDNDSNRPMSQQIRFSIVGYDNGSLTLFNQGSKGSNKSTPYY